MPDTRAEVSLQPMVKTIMIQCVPLQPREDGIGVCGCGLEKAVACGEPIQKQTHGRN